MKYTFISLILLSLNCLATPHELAGKFTFSSNIKKLSASVVEPVYAFTSVGRSRLAALKQEGYSCKAMPRQTFRCQKFDKSFTPRSSSLARINEEYKWETLEFIGTQSGPYIDSDDDYRYLKAYEFVGKVKFMGVVYERYAYWITKYSGHELHKLILNGKERHEFIVHSPERLTRVKSFSNQEKKRFFRFIFEGEFTLF